jgi:hypothetical protein
MMSTAMSAALAQAFAGLLAALEAAADCLAFFQLKKLCAMTTTTDTQRLGLRTIAPLTARTPHVSLCLATSAAQAVAALQ